MTERRQSAPFGSAFLAALLAGSMVLIVQYIVAQPDLNPLLFDYFDKANEAATSGDIDRAGILYDLGLDVYPEGRYSKKGYLGRAKVRTELDQFDDARLDINRVLALDPSDVRAYELQADLHASEEDFGAALAAIDRAFVFGDGDWALALFGARISLRSQIKAASWSLALGERERAYQFFDSGYYRHTPTFRLEETTYDALFLQTVDVLLSAAVEDGKIEYARDRLETVIFDLDRRKLDDSQMIELRDRLIPVMPKESNGHSGLIGSISVAGFYLVLILLFGTSLARLVGPP